MKSFVDSLDEITDAWSLILSTDFERSDLTQMIMDLEDKLSKHNNRIDRLVLLLDEIAMLDEIYQACYQEDSRTLDLVENKLIELRKEWRELSRRKNE